MPCLLWSPLTVWHVACASLPFVDQMKEVKRGVCCGRNRQFLIPTSISRVAWSWGQRLSEGLSALWSSRTHCCGSTWTHMSAFLCRSPVLLGSSVLTCLQWVGEPRRTAPALQHLGLALFPVAKPLHCCREASGDGWHTSDPVKVSWAGPGTRESRQGGCCSHCLVPWFICFENLGVVWGYL